MSSPAPQLVAKWRHRLRHYSKPHTKGQNPSIWPKFGDCRSQDSLLFLRCQLQLVAPNPGHRLAPKDTLWARPRPSRPKPSSGSDRPQMLVGISSIGCANKLITLSMDAIVPGLCLQNVRGHRAELGARTYASTASGPPDLVATSSPLHLTQTKLNVRKRGGSWTMTRPK